MAGEQCAWVLQRVALVYPSATSILCLWASANNMTPQRAKELLPVITAFANGETVECSATEWATKEVLIDASFDYPQMEYRIKPKPVTRQWQSTNDFPKVGSLWLRGKTDYREHLVIGLANDVAFITASCGCSPVLVSSHVQDWRMDQHEWSEDRKTWHECTVTEESK